MLPAATTTETSRDALLSQYQAVRAHTLALTQGLTDEDLCVQAMTDASPGKWHLAHTSWFFEVVVLKDLHPEHVPLDRRFWTLFNSYYNSLGRQHPRAQRGMLTRPGLAEVRRYRAHVDAGMCQLIEHQAAQGWDAMAWLTRLGLSHEAQHQELLLTDLLYLFSLNPLLPAVHPTLAPRPARLPTALTWVDVPGGIHEMGQDSTGFAFDHERPRHPVHLRPMSLASRPVTNAEFQAFIDDQGYGRPELWTSAGWDLVNREGWRSPLYWLSEGHAYGLQGVQSLDLHAPVCHISLHEAMAYAAWAGARLPTEAEWEVAQQRHPGQLGVGGVWEWTSSAFGPYPGYQPWSGALAEYNGKFMVDQVILRGASVATPHWSRRITCRNFFHPHTRWQFSGLRLARDA